MPSKEITDDLELLLRVMPPHIRDALHRQADLKNLIEVVMDLGRIATAVESSKMSNLNLNDNLLFLRTLPEELSS